MRYDDINAPIEQGDGAQRIGKRPRGKGPRLKEQSDAGARRHRSRTKGKDDHGKTGTVDGSMA